MKIVGIAGTIWDLCAVLRIHLILMRIQIRFLDPNPDQGHEHFFRIYWFFWQKKSFRIIFLLFMVMLNLVEEFFDNLSFFKSSDLGLRAKDLFSSFLLIFWPLGQGSQIVVNNEPCISLSFIFKSRIHLNFDFINTATWLRSLLQAWWKNLQPPKVSSAQVSQELTSQLDSDSALVYQG